MGFSGGSDGLFGTAGVDLFCFFSGSQGRTLEHRCLLLLRESDFCMWSGKKKVVFFALRTHLGFGLGMGRCVPSQEDASGGLKEVVA